MSKGCSRYFINLGLFTSFRQTMSTITKHKSELREDVSRKLAALSSKEKEKQSDVVVKKVLELPEFNHSQRVSIFLSTDNEINTRPIVETIFQKEKQCFIPRYSKNGMEMVKLHSMVDWENLPLTPWNIKQPKLKEERENALDTGGLDLIIVPGVAFTKNGKRLGHGGGYYDRYIRTIREKQKTPVVTVAVAFQEQILDDIPTHEHDEIIDKILYME
ncbi:5-formyltetrahydrofolate cyclo-ligase [Harmonia axyridis]|uniref:5-formyltetrahydrofolate cyclo-ligase n=1 Tax=Harmonia axyridis TaxID=115357 RepID=UPI001E276904|nr:5-formyltetrahydrofolate cyclo-ligase [Harmonia axyridis]